MYTLTEMSDPPVLRLRKNGWGIWSLEEKSKIDGKFLILCPAKDFHNVPCGTEMTCINGKKVVKGTDPIDEDTRGGMLAYGLLVNSIPDILLV